MNKFTSLAQKAHRSGLERSVIADARRHIPHIEQFISLHRFPVMPKIVVYSAAVNVDSFLNKYPPRHSESSPTTTPSLPN